MALCTQLLDEFQKIDMEDDNTKQEVEPFSFPPSMGNPSRNQRRRATRQARKAQAASASRRTVRRRLQRDPEAKARLDPRYTRGQGRYDNPNSVSFRIKRPRDQYRMGSINDAYERNTSLNEGKPYHRGMHGIVEYRRRHSGDETIGQDSSNNHFHLPRGMSLQEICYTIEIFMDNSLTADGSGVVLLQASNNPSFAPNWSNLAGPFEQYRVAEFGVRFEPLKTFGTASYGPIATCIDRDDATALSGYSVAARYSSYKLHAGQAPWAVHAYASGINELGFVDCTTPVADVWIKAYGSGNTASAVIGRILFRYVIIFKGLGLT